MTQSYYLSKLKLILALSSAIITTSANNVLAQNITIDGTLSPVQTLNGPIYIIPQSVGQTVGSNLFHSFGQFSLNQGERANFQSNANIRNIFSRVTGGSPSNINGLIFTQSGNVNLYLINPSGIVFGPNARLDVGSSSRGSFIATTADALVWSNGTQFSATNPGGTSSLLTIVGDPSGFLFNHRPPQPIRVSGSSLGVFEGQSLLLLGGDVSLDNSFLFVNFTEGGRIELGAVAEPGTVGLTTNGNILSLSFPENLARADVSLINRSILDVTAENGGSIAINARNIDFLSSSVVFAGIALGLGNFNSQAGDITINATDAITIHQSSRIQNTVAPYATGNAGNINITTNVLSLSNGARLLALSRGQGNTGSIVIAANNVSFDDGDVFSIVEPGAVGNSGNIRINTNLLTLTNGAQIAASTRGQGNAGSLIINAQKVLFDGTSSNGNFATAALSTVEPGAVGNSGNIHINTNSLAITNGAYVSVSTFGQGKADNLIINAREVLFDRGFAFSTVGQGALQDGGSIRISTDLLTLKNNAQLQASTFGEGNAGSVIIDALEVVLGDTRRDSNFPSVIASTVEQGAVGNGGSIRISTDLFTLNNGSQLLTLTRGQGNAGNVILAANNVSFDNGNIFSTVEQGAVGNGGSVHITTNLLTLTNGAQIAASTRGQGNASNIHITASEAVNISGTISVTGFSSGLFTSTFSTGKGGDITVNTNLFRLSDSAVVDARTANDDNAGNITVNANTVEVLNGGQLLSTTSGRGSAGTIRVNATERAIISGSDATFNDRVARFGGNVANVDAASGLFVRSDGLGSAGNIEVNSPFVLLDNGGRFIAESRSVNGGNISVNARNALLLRRGSQISTTAGTAQAGGNGGNININAGFVIALPQENSNITANAFSGTGGQVQINTQGIFGIEPRLNDSINSSDITASSTTGINGEIIINTPNVDPTQGLTNLPADTVNTASLVDSGCNTFDDKTGSQFTVTGRGGLPASPDDYLSSDVVWSDTRLTVAAKPQNGSASRVTTPQKSSHIVSIVPATGWVSNNQGEVTLVSQVAKADVYKVGSNHVACVKP
ncbi:S-layer family protein [Nostoc spongiaeforme FACHB-130]|uniref:S-layer family protein n=1 Tax=Nostoc spongiaeforme FACHB-130 TaxID=1357510 RepID=A0ABR8FWX5_9NOSO|nr:filamentous hemagglutinin N-terminal domain-containing protein [Nostoc spongiaeforme]MBD2595927.1 S-layer family protein [Nostoc spongiaeforme FACHB-130]